MYIVIIFLLAFCSQCAPDGGLQASSDVADNPTTAQEQPYTEDSSEVIVAAHDQTEASEDTQEQPHQESEDHQPEAEPHQTAQGQSVVAQQPLREDTTPKTLTLRALDKISAEVKTIKIPLGEMASFGRLRIVAITCKKSKPSEPPETTAFLRIYEQLPAQKEMQQLFSGWMFASSPTTSALSHPVYDVWVKSCVSHGKRKDEALSPAAPTPSAEEIASETNEGSIEE